jgi:nucleotide sugar dehydrogenase
MFISIVGVGRVGICIALYLDKIGHNVSCYDINDDIIKAINNKEINSVEPHVKEYLKNSNLIAHKFPSYVDNDIIIILVQTPSLENNSYDHSYIDNVIDNILKNGKSDNEKTIIITCTVMPEYCNSLYEKLLQYNYKLIYNPLFIAQGSIIYDIENHDMMLVGCLDDDNNIIEDMYKLKNTKFCKMTLLEAEISKISLTVLKLQK